MYLGMPSKKRPYGGTLSQPGGGGGKKKDVKCPKSKYLFTWEFLFGRKGVKLLFFFSFLYKEVKRKLLMWVGKCSPPCEKIWW